MRRWCAECRRSEKMAWDEAFEGHRCGTCNTPYSPSHRLTGREKALLAAFAARYQQRTGISLYARRDNGLPAPRDP